MEIAMAAANSMWSPPPMDTRNPRGVTSALAGSWVGIRYLLEGDWNDEEGVGHRNSHSLAETIKRKPCISTIGISSVELAHFRATAKLTNMALLF
ncbi:hypothetical protein EVAR_51332_1 [Eumeta japonica]|uniref:Uncharacterized protein n=1 Tax=Eumeta variegata TaxID=151549 RepID=A0A4C1Y0L6_EUMVA|nr:hypothetical protein EVAR_51332_1 [Eumeta japonica]